VDVFVLAMSSVNVVPLQLFMIFLANESRIDSQMQIAVRLIGTRGKTPISKAIVVLHENMDFEGRHRLVSVYSCKNLL
jgi:hypothetical protein